MNDTNTDFFAQSIKLLNLLLDGKEPTRDQIALLAVKLRQTYNEGAKSAEEHN